VISQAMGDAIWPGLDPIGREFRLGTDTMPMLTVVGVAENVSGSQIGGDPEFWYYLPVEQYRTMFGPSSPTLYVRVQGEAADFAEPIRARLQSEMPGDAYVMTMAMPELVAPRQRSWQLGATM